MSGRFTGQLSKEFVSYYSLICYELFLMKENLFGANFFSVVDLLCLLDSFKIILGSTILASL